jgi:hypothetical protein
MSEAECSSECTIKDDVNKPKEQQATKWSAYPALRNTRDQWIILGQNPFQCISLRQNQSEGEIDKGFYSTQNYKRKWDIHEHNQKLTYGSL